VPSQAAIIRWEEPPPPRGNLGSGRPPGSKYDRLTVELLARPGRSALIHEGLSRSTADSLVSRINSGQIRCFQPRGDFEACARKVDGTCRVYVRYSGSGPDA
jgi:hypothetical protein